MAYSWAARASALFLLLGLAAAACPEGMQLVGDGPRMRKAMLVGKLALGRNANQVCPMLPSFMAGVGLDDYHMCKFAVGALCGHERWAAGLLV